MAERFARWLGGVGRGERPWAWAAGALGAALFFGALFLISIADDHVNWVWLGFLVADLISATIWARRSRSSRP